MIVSVFLVIDGGVVGINIAGELRKNFSDSKVVIEKEKEIALHAGDRNTASLAFTCSILFSQNVCKGIQARSKTALLLLGNKD
jgi:hypothetical protein